MYSLCPLGTLVAETTFPVLAVHGISLTHVLYEINGKDSGGGRPIH